MTSLITVKADFVSVILKQVVMRVALTTSGRLAVVLYTNLKLPKAQETRDMGVQFHTKMPLAIENIWVAWDLATTR